MGDLVKFLMDNYIYIVFAAIIIILALIGYIVDVSKTSKLTKELTKNDKDEFSMPIVELGSGVTLNDTVSKTIEPLIESSVSNDSPVKPAEIVESKIVNENVKK